MIFLVMALYCEAEPLIRHFDMKRTKGKTNMPLFSNEKICLIISGTGMIRSSCATAYALSKKGYSKNDSLINLGICGSVNKKSMYEIAVCSKIKNHDSGKVFYPEMLLKHDFSEGSLESFSRPVDNPEGIKADFVDMEAAGFIECAQMFLPLQNIHCLKVVSDNLEGQKLEKEYVFSLINENLNKICSYLEKANMLSRINNDVITSCDYNLIKKISSSNHFTKSMYFQLLNLARYYKIKHNNLDILNSVIDCRCKNKLQSKQLFQKIKRLLEGMEIGLQ